MKQPAHKTARSIGIAAIAGTFLFGATVAGAIAFGVRINTTPSAPYGVWYVLSDAAPLAHGDLVEVCPPAQQPIVQHFAAEKYLPYGNCPVVQVVPLLKAVAAMPGDEVTIQAGHPATVNGQTLPNTQALPISAWPDGHYKVAEGHVWLFSTYSSGSFDSRYFGPVAMASIKGKAVPLLVSGNAADMMQVQP